MNPKSEICTLADDFTARYMEVLTAQLPKTCRTYGFEFEFLPDRPMTPKDLADVQAFLSRSGRYSDGVVFYENGVCVAFEPGGQIEFCSPPMSADEFERFDEIAEFIKQTNASVFSHLGIDYQARGYFPGRRNSPLCLTSKRYVDLHRRLGKSGTRGHEMMKATASIHLHVAICSIEELLPLFFRLCGLARNPLFAMSDQRRDIWNNTDPSRCGMPPCCAEQLKDVSQLIQRLITYGLSAVVLGEEVAFYKSSDISFESFLYHMTTIFTDVRFNLKGTTLELRTPDSMPVEDFRYRWKQFIEKTSDIC